MRINHNIAALNTYRQLSANGAQTNKALEKLSSGLRINKAGDDAAGLAISEKMRAQVRGLDQASRNAQDGISMVQTAEGGLNETHSILQRMRELADQSANGTNTEEDRKAIQDEVNQLTSEINRIGNTTEFNTQKLLNGGMNSGDSAKISEALSATKTLSANMTNGTTNSAVAAVLTTGAITDAAVTTATKATVDLTQTAADIADDVTVTVNGKTFDLSGLTMKASSTQANVDDNAALLGALEATDGSGVKLSELVDMTFDTDHMVFATKKAGGAAQIQFSATDVALGSTATTLVQGDGTSLIVGGKTFELGDTTIGTSNADELATTIAALGNITSWDGTTKLSELINVTGTVDSTGTANDGTLTFTTKATGANTSIRLESSADDTALGTDVANMAGSDNAVTGEDSTTITVDNITFDLGGVAINTSNIQTTIDSLNAVTSGGTKLSDLVDIKAVDSKLQFIAKSTGSTSTITFSGSQNDTAIGFVDTTDEVAVKGTPTTVERAGLEAYNALNATADINIASGATFKVAVGTESDVTVTLNKTSLPITYNTNDTDANVSKAAMDELVKDLNSALQDAGLSGKVSASLSKDNKIQFISETGVDIEVKDGNNTPLVSNLGFVDANTDMGLAKNVQQVVGPGVQGSGFTTTFQIGSNKGQTMSLQINDMRAAALGITGNAGQAGFTKENSVTNGTTDVKQEAALNVMNKEDASKSLEVLDNAIAKVSLERAKLGAISNRLEHTINNLGTSAENLTAAESRVRDVDMAKEMMEFTKNNILSQAAQAMLAQANQQPQGVLQLLR